MTSRDEGLSSNRALWDEWTDIHETSDFYDLVSFKQGGVGLRDYELEGEAQFVCSDIYELPTALEDSFDVVYTSRGVLGWLPDLEPWARVVAHFLRPGGVFYVSDIHPVTWVFDDTEEMEVRFPYFPRREPVAFPVKGSYADPRPM